MKKKVLVVVAHPDDEIIWMGGTLLRNKNKWNVTTVCICRASDKDREPKFWKVRKIIGDKGFIYDLDDESDRPLKRKEIVKIIKKHSDKEYDILFTHGEGGESGHQRHVDVHNAVKEMLRKGELKSKEVFFFSYLSRKNDYQGYCVYNSSADKLIKLGDDELEIKKKIQLEIYGYGKGGFEDLSCGKIEAFDKLKNENSSFIPLSS